MRRYVIPFADLALCALVGLGAPESVAQLPGQRGQQPGITALEGGLARYREVAARGGWPTIPPGPRLRPGDRDPRIPGLRARLRAEGYAVAALVGEATLYDQPLVTVVHRFQALHGLSEDGLVGPATLAALNVPAETRARQLAHTVEHWSPLLYSLGARYIVVNIPAFTLDLVEGGRQVWTTRVIVGRPDWPTPVVSSAITELVFRPLWRVPRSIGGLEVLPIVRRDSTYLGRAGIRLFHDSGAGGAEADPATVEWTSVTRANLTHHFVQEPGPENPLGGVKFVLHTSFGVYLHDTPARALFEQPRRTLSHGCVRVEDADRLASYLLPTWPLDSIQAAMTEGRERRVRLASPVPVHLVYWSAWVVPDGLAAFREDVYRLARPR